MPATTPTLQVRALRKRFGEAVALEDVKIGVEEGEVRGLLGPNGAGKTTLLRILLGLVRADSGDVEILGRTVAPGAWPTLAGVSGFVEEPAFYPYLSARVNLEILAGLDNDSAGGPAISDALEEVDLSARADERVSGYSTGMRKRLGIAAALIRAPRLLLLDEPTAGLDPAGIHFLLGLIESLSKRGVAVLLSSHQIDDIEQLCDSVTVIDRGRVLWDGAMQEMRRQAAPASYRLFTSDDSLALGIATDHPGILARDARAGGLTLAVEGNQRVLDQFVLALARAGVAVRLLELEMSPLEAMFFALTSSAQATPGAGEAPLQR